MTRLFRIHLIKKALIFSTNKVFLYLTSDLLETIFTKDFNFCFFLFLEHNLRENLVVHLHDEVVISQMQNVTIFFLNCHQTLSQNRDALWLKRLTISHNRLLNYLSLEKKFVSNIYFSNKECSTYRYYSARRKRSLIMITIMMIGIGDHTYIASSKWVGGWVGS